MEVAQPGVPAAPELGQSEHDKAMLAKVDSAMGTPPAEPPAPATRPEHIPEKFWDAEKGQVKVEDLAKSYLELEKSRSKAPAQEPQQQPGGEPPADGAAAAAAEAAKAAGADISKVDFEALSKSFFEKGELSTDEYATLEKSGLPRALVDQFIAGQQAQAQIVVAEAQALAGGAEQYKAMIDWAGKNLTQAEQGAFDAAVAGDAATRSMAITALKARFAEAVGSPPTLVKGGQGAPAGAYQSRAEVVRDMQDPRYNSDPAFRAEVERKLMNSSVF